MEYETLKLRCPGIGADGKFAVKHTGRGKNRSPEFILENLSMEAQTLAIILEDLSHPIPNFTHWVIWNIPARDKIPGGIPAGRTVSRLGGASQGMAYGLHRYAGPKPPKGKSHTYRFTVYALDGWLELSGRTTKRGFLKKIAGHVLQSGSISGEFE